MSTAAAYALREGEERILQVTMTGLTAANPTYTYNPTYPGLPTGYRLNNDIQGTHRLEVGVTGVAVPNNPINLAANRSYSAYCYVAEHATVQATSVSGVSTLTAGDVTVLVSGGSLSVFTMDGIAEAFNIGVTNNNNGFAIATSSVDTRDVLFPLMGLDTPILPSNLQQLGEEGSLSGSLGAMMGCRGTPPYSASTAGYYIWQQYAIVPCLSPYGEARMHYYDLCTVMRLTTTSPQTIMPFIPDLYGPLSSIALCCGEVAFEADLQNVLAAITMSTGAINLTGNFFTNKTDYRALATKYFTQLTFFFKDKLGNAVTFASGVPYFSATLRPKRI